MSDQELYDWTFQKASGVHDYLADMAESRFKENGVWEQQVTADNVEDYNEAIGTIEFDCTDYFAESICESFGVLKGWIGEEHIGQYPYGG